eukprot:COSAG06_NODE_29297_length_559_cov_0.789130_2_plen_34_part_01
MRCRREWPPRTVKLGPARSEHKLAQTGLSNELQQ